MLNERKLTERELESREVVLQSLLKNKRNLVKRYGKDAEKVMYGIATKKAKTKVEGMNKDKIKELITKTLSEETFEDEIERLEKTMYIDRRDGGRLFIHPLSKPDVRRPDKSYIAIDGNNVTSVQGYNSGPISDLADRYSLDDEDSRMTPMGQTSASGRISLLSSNILRDAIKAIQDARDVEAKKQQDYYRERGPVSGVGNMDEMIKSIVKEKLTKKSLEEDLDLYYKKGFKDQTALVKRVWGSKDVEEKRKILHYMINNLPKATREKKFSLKQNVNRMSASKLDLFANNLLHRDSKMTSMEEKLTKSSSVEDHIDDFKDSDAPQFKGKSADKKVQMAVASFLSKQKK